MHNCVSCGGVLLRVRRTFAQRFIYQAVLECKECGQREGLWYLFLLGRNTHCPRCWNVRLQKLSSVDHIDAMYTNPVSYFQKWFGAHLYCCSICRLQFYDLRERYECARRLKAASRTPMSSPEVRG
jgi:hypothetical protein